MDNREYADQVIEKVLPSKGFAFKYQHNLKRILIELNIEEFINYQFGDRYNSEILVQEIKRVYNQIFKSKIGVNLYKWGRQWSREEHDTRYPIGELAKKLIIKRSEFRTDLIERFKILAEEILSRQNWVEKCKLEIVEQLPDDLKGCDVELVSDLMKDEPEEYRYQIGTYTQQGVAWYTIMRETTGKYLIINVDLSQSREELIKSALLTLE